MPLVTAGLGLITGVALIGLATRVTNMANVSPELALMIGLGVGIDYALFIVTRFRENYLESGDVERSIVEAMDTSGRAILLAGATVVIALLGMFATGVAFMYGLAIAAVLAVLLSFGVADCCPRCCRASVLASSPTAGARRREAHAARPSLPLALAKWSETVQCEPMAAGDRLSAVMLVLGAGARDAPRRSATPGTIRPAPAPGRPSICSRRASGPGSTGRCCLWPSSTRRQLKARSGSCAPR